MSDNFVKYRVFIWIVALLVLLNLATLALVWFGNPFGRDKMPPHPPPPEHVSGFFKKELGWNKVQSETFEKSRISYFNKSESLIDSIHNFRSVLYNSIGKESINPERQDSLFKSIGVIQSELDKLRFSHFKEIDSICDTPEQKEKFRSILMDIFLPMPTPENRRFAPPMRK